MFFGNSFLIMSVAMQHIIPCTQRQHHSDFVVLKRMDRECAATAFADVQPPRCNGSSFNEKALKFTRARVHRA
jgi:hypothetical protein